MSLSPEQTAFLAFVKTHWANGSTQQQIADELGLSLSTLRNRLAHYGYEFARAGKLVAKRAPELD